MRGLLREPRVLGPFALSALLLSCNWLVYVWAVQNHNVLDASLGYFMLPLVNVALGYVFLHERPRPGQWLAVCVAATGVLWLTVQTDRLPWIALLLASSFGFYGLLRNVAVLGALEGFQLVSTHRQRHECFYKLLIGLCISLTLQACAVVAVAARVPQLLAPNHVGAQ